MMIKQSKTTSWAAMATFAGLFVLAFAVQKPALAKVPACTETVQISDTGTWSSKDSACTSAQLRAWVRANYDLENDQYQWTYGDINDNANVKRLYLAYLDLVYNGYTPNDTNLNSAETAFRDAALAANISEVDISYAVIGFNLSDVFPGYWNDINEVMFRGDRRAALAWVEDQECGVSFCNPSDRVVRLLGGKDNDSDKESLFVDNGFRVTGVVDTDYTSFGVWAPKQLLGVLAI